MKKLTLRLCFLTLLLALVIMPAAAQDDSGDDAFYTPRHIQAAYENSTRSRDGQPGKNYWQNRSTYHMTINVAPPDRTITATEDITYYNNSPDTLNSVVFRLYLNIHKPEAVRETRHSADFINDGIQVKKFKINGEVVRWNEPVTTLAEVVLPEPLEPGGSVEFSFDWQFEPSAENWKEGVVDDTTFFLAYFFPRVAVYDDIDGWERSEFSSIAREYYNDFGDYTFEVNLPPNFVVWSTGELQNPEEVLQPEYAQRLEDSFTSDDTINIAQPDEFQQGLVTSQDDTITWKWKADNVEDIALGISDHYVWDAGSVVVDAETGRRASMQAAYQAETENFATMVAIGNFALTFGSTKYPAVPYPYPKMTIFEGNADEEYPMMANDASETIPGYPQLAPWVAGHEILHSWFPFYMGINESRYPLMDEGMVTAFEYDFMDEVYGADALKDLYIYIRTAEWTDGQVFEDLPIITPNDSVRSLYGSSLLNYGKPALAYRALEELMGTENYLAALHEFMERWNGKHPTPWDFFYTFNDVADEDLTWFFQQWFFTTDYLDLAIVDAQPAGGGYDIQVENIGGMPMPFDVQISYADGTLETVRQSPAVWEDDPEMAAIHVTTSGDVEKLALDGGIFYESDATLGDNLWEKG